jgi:hypothetical protein
LHDVALAMKSEESIAMLSEYWLMETVPFAVEPTIRILDDIISPMKPPAC